MYPLERAGVSLAGLGLGLGFIEYNEYNQTNMKHYKRGKEVSIKRKDHPSVHISKRCKDSTSNILALSLLCTFVIQNVGVEG